MSAYRSKGGTLVPLTSLRLTFQMPLLLEPAKAQHFADLMSNGQEFPPVQVRKTAGEAYELLDGHHRQRASHLCSFTHIPVEIMDE